MADNVAFKWSTARYNGGRGKHYWMLKYSELFYLPTKYSTETTSSQQDLMFSEHCH